MKLRLPHRLHAALVAALASVSFTTLCSGALTAAFFLGSQAFAEEAADNPAATIDIGDTNLDAQAAIDEEEGKGEAKEPGSAPINQAGFNGVIGSSDDFDRQSTAATESSIDTENVGTADQANYGSASADLPSNDLGFTSNSYASGSSNGSVVDSPVTSFTPATAVPAVQQVQYVESTAPTTSSGTTTTGAATGGYSATPVSGATGGGSGYSLSSPAMPRAAVVTVPATTDATDPAAEAAKTDSGSADSTPADELGSTTPSLSVGGASLVKASYSAPAPAMLGAAGRNITTATTVAGDTTYNGLVYTMANSGSTFHTRVFQRVVYNEESSQWENTGDPIASGNTDVKTPLGTGYFWTMYCATASAGHGIDYGNTLRLTGATGQQRSETQFTDFAIGGLIADDSYLDSSFGTPAYWFYRNASMAIVGANDVIMDVDSHVRFSYKDNVNVMKGGTWTIHSGKTLTFDNNAGAAPTTFNLYANQELTVKGGGTLYIGRDGNGRYNLTLNAGSVLNITGNSTVQASANGDAGSALTNNGTINVEAGSKFVVSMNGSGSGDINAAGTVQMINGSTNERTLSKLTLSGGTLENTSGNETMKRNITELAVNGSSRLEQSSWNTFWKISHLNKGTDTGARTLTWNMDTNHWSNSILYLLDEGSFDGELVANRASGQAGNGNYQAYVEIGHANALKDGIINLNSPNASSVMSLALNADTVNLAGLKGTADSIVYAGAANATTGSSTSKQGEVVPGSTGASTLNLNVAQGGNYTYAGKVLSGVGIQKSGAGTQTFSGDMSGFNGDIAVSAGTLALSSTVASADSVSVTGGTFDLGAALTTTGNLSVASGATLKFAGKEMLTVGGNLTLNGSLDVSRIAYAEGATVTLGSYSGTADITGASLSGLGGHQATLSAESGALTLTFGGQPEPAPTNIGKWMAIGDSITHGTNDYSYRWGLQKIFIDNGIDSEAIGVQHTCYTSAYDTASYGGTSYDNDHCAQFNVYAQEVSGNGNVERYYGDEGQAWSLWYSNVKNWLGTDNQLTADKGTYPDPRMGDRGITFEGADSPETYTLMLGTNDLVGGRTAEQLLGDVEDIVDTIQARAHADGKEVTVFMMSVPYTGKRLTTANINAYNSALKTWISQESYANLDIRFVNINEGFMDVTKASSDYSAVSSMLQDWAHPTAQGNLIISGNLARGMGYAGRTAGQFRKAAGEFSQHDYAGGFSAVPSDATNVTLSGNALNFGASGSSSASFAWDTTPTGGYTVDFSLLLGDGASNNWDTSTNFSVNLGNGTLNVNEAYIQWGSTILYSRDASTTANLRVAYVQGDTANNLAAGYYVWLGDQLIGEACTASGSVANAVTFSYSGSGNALLKSLAMDSTGSWAPTTNLTEGDDGYHANPFVDGFRISTRQGEGDFSQANVGATVTNIVSDNRKGTVGQVPYYYAYYGNGKQIGMLGDCHIWSFNNTEGSDSVHYVTYGLGTDSTAVVARLAGASMQFHTVHGLYNTTASNMGADVLTQLDSVGGSFGSYHGSEKMGSTGKVALTMNEGTISGDVVGGFAVVANNSQTIASTEININSHGVVGGNVYGGSTANGTVTNAKVTITGGRIGGSVYGGGTAGTVGTATVEITGGEITGGVHGGGNGDTITGSTSVTVKTYVPYIHGSIDADTVTISDLHAGPSSDEHGFDKYTGTITADTITLYNDTTFSSSAKLVTKTLNVQHNSSVTIHDLQLTACAINVDSSSVATLDGTLTLGNSATYTGTLNLANGLKIDVSNIEMGEYTTPVNLLTTTSGNLGSTNVKNITLDFGESQEPSYYNLVRSGENLMLTFEDPTANALIWDGGTGTWNKQNSNWRKQDAETGLVFTDGSDVRFDSASNNCTVTVGEAVQANSMTIDKDVAVTIANGNNLTTTLKGEGTYVLPNAQATLPGGVTLDSAEWTGAVRLSGNITALRFVTKAANAAYGLATENSVIELKGVSGWMRTEAQLNNEDHIGTAHNANIRLVNVDSTTPALKITDGGSNSITTLSGKVTGNGTFEHNWGGGACTFKLTGDLSEWTGDFKKTNGNTTTLALTDNTSTTIAPHIKNTGSGTLNVNINNSNAVTLTGDISKTNGALNLNVGNEKATDATFSGTITGANLNVGANSTATISHTSNVGNVTGTGTVVVTDGTTLTVGSSTGDFTNVTVNSGATLVIDGKNNTDYRMRYTLDGGTLTNTGSNTGGGSVQNDQITLTANSTISGSSNFYMLGSDYGKTELHLDTHTLEKTGTNEITMYSTDVSGGGTLKITNGSLNITRNNGNKPMSLVNANIELNKGGSDALKGNFNLAGGHSITSTVSDARMAASVGMQGATTLSAGAGSSLTASGVLSGSGPITKTGNGIVTLSGTNTYNGGTTINAGTLVAGSSSALGTGAVTLSSGTLDITSTLNTGALTMDGGTLALHNASALTTTGNLVFTSGTLDLTGMDIQAGNNYILATTSGGSLTLDNNNVTFTLNNSTLKDQFSLEQQGNSLVLTYSQPGEWPAGSHVRYTYTPEGTTEAEVHFDIQSGTITPHGYDFSQADGGVVEFNPALFTDANNHTYTDTEQRDIKLYSDTTFDTTFIVEEGNTVHLGAATVRGKDDTDHGVSGTFIKDGGGTMELALNSSVITVPNPGGGSALECNKYEGSVIVKDGTLRILQNATGDTTKYHSSILAHEGDFLEVYKDATLVLDSNTNISIPVGNENSQEGRTGVVLSAGTKEAVLRNVVLNESGMHPQDDAAGARASVTGDDLNISNLNDLQHEISINASDITVNSFTLIGLSTIDDSHITVKGETYITGDSSIPTKIQNHSVVDVQTDYLAMLQNADVDKTSKINASGGEMRALVGSIKVEVGSSDGGVAVRTDQANTVTYTSDQLAGWQGESWDSPLSLSLTLSDMNLPEDPTDYTFKVILTDFDSSALGILPDADPVPLDENLNVELFVPQYASQSEMLATMKVQYTGGNTVFIFEGVRVPEPTTGTLSLLALAALAARRRRK